MNGEKLPCFWLIKFFIMFLIRLLLVTSWFMAALLLCLVESIPLMYQLASARMFSVSMATSQCCITGKKTCVAITVSVIKRGSPQRDWK